MRRQKSAVTADRRFAVVQPAGSFHMQSDIAIAETEPGFAAQSFHGFHERPGFVVTAPAEFAIGQPGQRVRHGIDVGRDRQAEMLEIVAGVDDDEQFLGRHDARQTQREFGAADAAGEGDDHRNRSSSGGRTSSAIGASGAVQRQAAHDDDGLALGGLALQQGRGGGDLVGETDDADFKDAAEQIGLAAQVDQRRQAGAADRDAGGAAAPGAAEAVADHAHRV